jgi:hypothetical protein
MDDTDPTPAPTPEPLEAEPASEWLTRYRVPHPAGVALVQKRDGCTRTLLMPRGY